MLSTMEHRELTAFLDGVTPSVLANVSELAPDQASTSWTTTVGAVAAALAAASATNSSREVDGGELDVGFNYSLSKTVFIIIVAGLLILITVVGNIMVMVSFHIDKQLQTVSNCFLFSLAVADFAVGVISMPLFTFYQVMGRWQLGSFVCDTWLAIDYLVSNASVLNLLIISFDRYFSVTRPLTYRARRTNHRAAVMIASAWLISLALWPPWIFAWPYIEGERTVPADQCYIQFIETNNYATFGTAVAAFYLPVVIMSGLYYRIWQETEQRKRDLDQLQALKRAPSKRPLASVRSHRCLTDNKRKQHRVSSGDRVNTKINHRMRLSVLLNDHEDKQPRISLLQRCMRACWRSGRGCSNTHGDRSKQSRERASTLHETPLQNSVLSRWMTHRGAARLLQNSDARDASSSTMTTTATGRPRLRHTKSDAAQYQDTPSVYTCQYGRHQIPSPLPILRTLKRHHSSATLTRCRPRSVSAESVYTIVIKLPEPTSATTVADASITTAADPSITMISEPESECSDDLVEPTVPASSAAADKALSPTVSSPASATQCRDPQAVGERSSSTAATVKTPRQQSATSGTSLSQAGDASSEDNEEMSATVKTSKTSASRSTAPRSSVATTAGDATPGSRSVRSTSLSRQLAPRSGVVGPVQPKKKRKRDEKKQDRKAAKTLSAILLAFIITWTPYNVLVLLRGMLKCDQCIPTELWNFAYYLCYINSTVNPLCYALCNASFRRTYVKILTCTWQKAKPHIPARAVHKV